jgi:hypothetical protein
MKKEDDSVIRLESIQKALCKLSDENLSEVILRKISRR